MPLREENSPSLPSHKTNSSPVFGPDIQGTRSVGSVFRGNTLAPFTQIQNAMNLSQWEKRLLPLFFSRDSGDSLLSAEPETGSCTSLKSRCLYLQQVIPFKWAASHFSSQNLVTEHLETSSEHREPLLSAWSCRDKEFPCYRQKSPNLLASSAQQHLRLQPDSYVLFIWHTIFHQEDSLARAFKGSTFTLQQVLKQKEFWNKRPHIWPIVLYCFLFAVC